MLFMVIGVFTNSWWKLERGWQWRGVGLLEQKFCVDPPGVSERCQAVKHALVRKTIVEMSKNWVMYRTKMQQALKSPRFKNVTNREELQAGIDRLDEMIGSAENIDITIGDGSWETMGKFVYYGTFLVLILLAVALSMSRIEHEQAALVDKIAAGACLALLTVALAFAFRVPDYIKHAIPAYGAGYSRWLYLAGASAGTAAGVLLAMAAKEAEGQPVGVRLAEHLDGGSRGGGTAQRGNKGKGGTASLPTCPKCGSRAIYREDVNCYICERCRINV